MHITEGILSEVTYAQQEFGYFRGFPFKRPVYEYRGRYDGR
jgi:hypothetical protein